MRIFYAVCIFALVGCSSSPPIIPQSKPAGPKAAPKYAPPLKQQTPTAARMTGDWTDWPIAQGSWVYRTDARGSIAMFGQEQRDAAVTIRCDRAQSRIYLTRADEAGGGTGAGGAITIRTSSALKTIAASSTGGNLAYIAAEILPADPILDAIIYTRGRFALQGGGGRGIAVPVYAEIAKVVEDCRA